MPSSHPALGRMVAAAATAVAVSAAAVIYLTHPASDRVPGISTHAEIGGPFRLTAPDGAVVDSQDLKGKPYAVFFGFTHCPDVCPTTLSQVSRTLHELGPEAKDLRVYFITVDPERDRPDVLRDYLSNFDSRIVGLWGTPDQIAVVAKEFKAFYEKVPTSDGGYTMNHTAILYLMDRNGEYSAPVGYAEDEAGYLAKFRALLEGS